ncbi:O-acyltransferase WSD1-like [Chenopodium quinoa]|uniref:Diacylglycerol O-acyltransferase n=1 Tax=Chenopodium quinoa TaxID=63459 RepID=A0A803LGY4_CHEQI|nr:O-acyltransferase WSD1-like [Chenopodium quinoa]
MEANRDEPVTPAGRLFLQAHFNQIINCAIGFKEPLNIEAIKTDISNCLMVKHPRFCSLLVLDDHGREYWRRTQINLDDHIIIHHKNPGFDSDSNSVEKIEEKINSLLADFAVSSPLSTDKPLWELHLISELKCVILRIHHSLGDGISLMSMFLASCKRLDGNNEVGFTEKNRENRGDAKKVRKRGLLDILKIFWWTILSVIGFFGKCLWDSDTKTAVSGGDGVELWPRTAATAKFSLKDMKAVKGAIPNATINDVLFGIISSGFSKYLDIRSSHALQEGLKITGIAMVNLRKQPGLQEMSKLMEDNSRARWGNQFGMILLPIYCHTKDPDPLNYVKRAKVMIDRKKQSLEAHFSYNIGNLAMSLLGPKYASILNHRILCNTTFTISNMVGPQEELMFADNPITYIRPTSSSLPHAITMHMVSYAGMANMQILVAKEIVPDPRFLAKCFEDGLLEMKNAVIL